ncbi:short chain dehydrogenase [Diaporthe helianthi]|uniref:Short chain dehydrogenase n=1 Tax=Diaporthe helianthi TaxID=158607 RepID=A0A2P5I6K7_DIAHE|nr:short chain dehydrogenase [Diaporthe helianthi]
MSGSTGNPTELFSVNGMVALITGGGTGVGLMMAKALANAGAAKVYIAGRRLEVLESGPSAGLTQSLAVKTINKPDVVVPLTCDVTSQDSLNSLVSEVEKRSGYLNLLVCNSGIGGPQVPYPSAETSLQEFREKTLAIPMDEYEKTFTVNVTAVWYTAMAFLELLDEGNKKGNLDWHGQVLVTSSIAGFNKKAPGGWAYGQSKAAATHSAKQLAGVLPKWGIRANALAPGLFPSEMSAPIVEAMGGSVSGEGLIPLNKNVVPLGRMGDTQDMMGTVLYLVSRAGAYLNGNVTVLDGGRLGTFPSTY